MNPLLLIISTYIWTGFFYTSLKWLKPSFRREMRQTYQNAINERHSSAALAAMISVVLFSIIAWPWFIYETRKRRRAMKQEQIDEEIDVHNTSNS